MNGSASLSTPERTHPYRSWAGPLAVLPVLFVVIFAVIPTITLSRRIESFAAFGDVLSNPSIREALWFSLWQSAVSALVCVTVSLPITWVLARFEFPGRKLVRTLVTIPFLLPTVVVGVSFLALLPDRLDYTPMAIIVAHAYFNVAVIVRIVGARWESTSTNLLPAALTLGATPVRAAMTITLPILSRSLATATGLVAVFSFTSFGVVRMLGGPSWSTIETEIYSRAVLVGDVDGAVALAVLQVIFLLVVGLVVFRTTTDRPLRSGMPETHRRPLATSGHEWLVWLIIALTIAWTTAPWWAAISRSFGGWGFVGQREFRDALLVTLRTAAVCALVAGFLGTCSALAATYGGRLSRLTIGLTALPLTISAVVIGFGFLITFDEGMFDLRSSWIITPLAHCLIAIPLATFVVAQRARAIPRDVSAAAMTLGASRWRAWRTIDGPLLARTIASAIALSAAVSLGEFGASSFLSRRNSTTFPLVMAQELSRPGELRAAHAYVVATLFIVTSIVVIFGIEGARGVRR